MTSINAIRFDFHSGALICDEQRGWNSENLKINSADKIKPVVEPEIRARTGLVAYYGNTGTSSIGDELKDAIRRRVSERFQAQKKKLGRVPDELMTIEDLALIAFEAQTQMKRGHIDQTLAGRYGFGSNDFVQGFYSRDGVRHDICQKEIVDDVLAALTWKGRTGEMTPVFLNAGIVAGFEPREGFRIFHLSIIDGLVEPVQEIFLADGSGRDLANVRLAEYSQHKSVPERRGAIDPVDGIWAAIEAVNAAALHNLGVDGYFNIMVVDGRRAPEERVWEINDDRAKLAAEIIRATEHELLPRERARSIVGQLIFGGGSFEKGHAAMFKAARDRTRLDRFLRGYRCAKGQC